MKIVHNALLIVCGCFGDKSMPVITACIFYDGLSEVSSILIYSSRSTDHDRLSEIDDLVWEDIYYLQSFSKENCIFCQAVLFSQVLYFLDFSSLQKV